MRIAAALLVASFFVAPVFVQAQDTKATTSPAPVIVYTAAKTVRPLAWLRGMERFPLGAALFIRDDKGSRKLVPSFAASADANVSFDAKRVVFAGRPKPQSRWEVWEVDLHSRQLRRVIAGGDDVVRPMYLPDNRIVYARKRGGRFVIESASLDGKDPLILYYLPGNALPTDVLKDGRILFQAGYPLGTAIRPELYTVYSDGSGVESYRCDHGATRYAGKQIGSGDIVFTHGSSLARFTSPLAEEKKIEVPAGEYAGDVAESGSGEWIISHRARPGASFSLVSWTPGTQTFQPLAATPGVHLLQPALVAEHTVPNRHPSALHEWKTANLLALNSHFTREGLLDADIVTVRLYTLDEKGKTVELGTAPVENDGSFYVSVPGDRPVRFELLDEKGKTIKREAGWMWARAGEQRICVGCHAGPENAPDNATPQVLLKSTKPVDLASSHSTKQQGGR